MKSSLKIVGKTNITFSLSEKHCLSFLNKNMFYFWKNVFWRFLRTQLPQHFFWRGRCYKTLDMSRQKFQILQWQNLLIQCFSVSDKHGQTDNVIWLCTAWHLIFPLEVASKKPFFTTNSVSTWEIMKNWFLTLLKLFAIYQSEQKK